MANFIEVKRKTNLHWDKIPIDGDFVGLGELQRAIAKKKAPDLVDRAEEAIALLGEGDIELTNPSHQFLKFSKVTYRLVPLHNRKQEFGLRRPPALASAVPGRATFGSEAFAPPADDIEAIAQRMQAENDAAPAATRGRGRGRRGGYGGFGRGFSSQPQPCRICGSTDHDMADCPERDHVQRKTVPSGIPTDSFIPDEQGTFLMPGNVPARLRSDAEAFQRIVGGRSTPELPFLPPSSDEPDLAGALDAPPSGPALALTQFAHADEPSLPPLHPELAGGDMVFDEELLDQPLANFSNRSPLPPRSPQHDPSQEQLARLASMELRSKEEELTRIQQKLGAGRAPLTQDEFALFQRLPQEIKEGKQAQEQRRRALWEQQQHQQQLKLQQQRQQQQQQARSQPSPLRRQHMHSEHAGRSRSRSRSPSRRRPSPRRDRSPGRDHHHRYSSRSRNHQRRHSPSPSGYSSEGHDDRRRDTRRSRRHRSPSYSRSPSYHSRDGRSRRPRHDQRKRNRPAERQPPQPTGLSSPSQSREPTPALAQSPRRSPSPEPVAPVRASTPQLAGALEDEEEHGGMEQLVANKRPRTSRWTAGSGLQHPTKAVPAAQQQQKPNRAGHADRTVEPVQESAQAKEQKIRLGDLPICQLLALLQNPQCPVLPLPPAFPWLGVG